MTEDASGAAGAADTGALPEVLARIAEATSPKVALRFAHDFGGREFYLPEKLGDDHPLAQSVGRGNAQAIIDLFGAGRLLVPLGPTAAGRRQAALIAQMIEENKSRGDISRALHVHVRTVSRHRRRLERTDERQPDLFSPD